MKINKEEIFPLEVTIGDKLYKSDTIDYITNKEDVIQKYAYINKGRLFTVTDNTIFLTITEPTYTDESTLVIYKPEYGKAFNVND